MVSNVIKGVECIFTAADTLRHLYITGTVRKPCGPIQEWHQEPDFLPTQLRGRGHHFETVKENLVPVYVFHGAASLKRSVLN